MQTKTNASAILRGEQRSKRFSYRHSVAAAAQEVGIPATWVWFWLLAKRLKFRMGLRKVWVRLQAVQELCADPLALRDAFYATGEFLTSPEAIQRFVERWPDEEHVYVKFQPSSKRPPQSAKANPVLCEEEKSEESA